MNRDVDELNGEFDKQNVLVVAGGPSLDRCEPRSFDNWPKIMVNYSHRAWRIAGAMCGDYCVVVKDYIYEHVKNDLSPASLVVPRCVGAARDKGHYLWDPVGQPENIVDDPRPNSLYSHQAGGAGAAIHLAYKMGAAAVFVIGMDLGFEGDKYHPEGYWKTTEFRPSGWRQTPEDAEAMFARSATHIRLVQQQLAKAGCPLYFISPDHWRHKWNEQDRSDTKSCEVG